MKSTSKTDLVKNIRKLFLWLTSINFPMGSIIIPTDKNRLEGISICKCVCHNLSRSPNISLLAFSAVLAYSLKQLFDLENVILLSSPELLLWLWLWLWLLQHVKLKHVHVCVCQIISLMTCDLMEKITGCLVFFERHDLQPASHSQDSIFSQTMCRSAF